MIVPRVELTWKASTWILCNNRIFRFHFLFQISTTRFWISLLPADFFGSSVLTVPVTVSHATDLVHSVIGNAISIDRIVLF